MNSISNFPSNHHHSPPPLTKSSNSDRNQLICQLVRRYLLYSQVSASEWTRNESALVMLAESILGSSMSPSTNLSNEDSVVEVINKRLLRNEGVEKAVRFSQLLSELQKNYPTRKLWSILYFLQRTSEKNGKGSSSARMADILTSSIEPKVIMVESPMNSQIEVNQISLCNIDKAIPEYWKQYNELKQKNNQLSTTSILKDLVFPLQGVDGNTIKFSETADSFKMSNSVLVSNSIRGLVNKIVECGTLYYKIRKIIVLSQSSAGSFRQSLIHAIEIELREYLKVVACFEASVSCGDEMISLRKALVWFGSEETLGKLQFLLLLLSEVANLNGGALITAVNKHSLHGNPAITSLISRLMKELLYSFCSILCEFIKNGTLQDPHNEFFVLCSPSNSGDTWSNRFVIEPAKIPSILDKNVSLKVLLTGKTRSFLAAMKKNDTESMDIDYPVISEDASQLSLDLSKITKLINDEHLLACQELSQLLLKKYRLKDHFYIVKNYLHFGRGDFGSALMESVGSQLSKPSGSVFRHALVSCLDQALLSLPNNDLSTEIRDRMDVKLHDSSHTKMTGWDVFTLDYKVGFPLDVILTPSSMTEHVRLSHYLWSLRRVTFVMNNAWSRVMNLQRLRIPDIEIDLKRLQLFIQEGSNFARQIFEYSMSVVHQCWDKFFLDLDGCNEKSEFGLDIFIESHEKLLSNLKDALFIFGNSNIKPKLASILSALLRSEAAIKGFERYVNLSLEHNRRQSGLSTFRQRLSSSFTIPAEDEAILDTFSSHQFRLLTEQRATFQNFVRVFQTDFDEFFLVLQKEAMMSGGLTKTVSQLMNILDWSGYHRRRNGLDQKKYCAPSR